MATTTVEMLSSAPVRLNPLGDRELCLRDAAICALANFGAVPDQFDALDLGHNALVSFASNIPTYLRVTSINLSRNNLTSVDFSSFPNLAHLDVTGNAGLTEDVLFEGLVGKCPKLETIRADVHIADASRWLASFVQLHTINLRRVTYAQRKASLAGGSVVMKIAASERDLGEDERTHVLSLMEAAEDDEQLAKYEAYLKEPRLFFNSQEFKEFKKRAAPEEPVAVAKKARTASNASSSKKTRAASNASDAPAKKARTASGTSSAKKTRAASNASESSAKKARAASDASADAPRTKKTQRFYSFLFSAEKEEAFPYRPCN